MSEQEPQRKKGGRPRKHSPEAKRPTMSFRMGSNLHQLLIDASISNERSLSEEIERRLEDSFRARELAKAAALKTVDVLEASFGSGEMMDVSMSLTYALHQAIGRQEATIEDFWRDRGKRDSILANYAEALPHFMNFLVMNTKLGTGKFREVLVSQFEGPDWTPDASVPDE